MDLHMYTCDPSTLLDKACADRDALAAELTALRRVVRALVILAPRSFLSELSYRDEHGALAVEAALRGEP